MNKQIILLSGAALLLILLIGCTEPSCGDQQCQAGENDSTSENYCPNDCIDSNTPTTIDCDLDGDGIVDEKEQDKCEQDPPITSETCGDGTCDEKELENNSCPTDCGGGVTPPPNPPPTGEFEDSPFGVSHDLHVLEELVEVSTLFGYDSGYPIFPEGTTKEIYNDLGLTWVRGGLSWEEMQNSPERGGQLNFDLADSIIVEDYQEGIKRIFNWHAVADWDQETCRPEGNYCDMPCDIEAYKNYMRELVERYDGDENFGTYPISEETKNAIRNNPWKYWELGNEPNFFFEFFRPCNVTPDDSKEQITALASKDYFDVLQATYEAVHDSCPVSDGCKVYIGGLGDVWGDHVLRGNLGGFGDYLFDQEAGYYDIMNYHSYDLIGGSSQGIEAKANYFYENFPDKLPFAITEIGFPSGGAEESEEYGNLSLNEISQASQLVSQYSIYLEKGVRQFIWFGLIDPSPVCPPAPKNCYNNSIWGNMGLLKYDGNKKLAYYSYKLYSEKLTGSNWDSTELVYNQNYIHAYKFMKDGEPIHVVWWDYWEEPTQSSKTISLNDLGITESVTITDAVPHFENGLLLQNSGEVYPNFFDTTTSSTTITLEQSPVYIE